MHIFGKIDIVATAPGRIIVSDRTKVIQQLEASVVRKVLGKDGDKVIGLQVLVELHPTNANAGKASVSEQHGTAAIKKGAANTRIYWDRGQFYR